MRIVGGEYKGRPIKPPIGDATRPTTDRVREALMSSVLSAISCDIDSCHVLDAFAGTGALGLEALSRGASSCCFFEKDPRTGRILRENIASLGLDSKGKTLGDKTCLLCPVDVLRAAKAGAIALSPFDLVFLDPPYAMPVAEVLGFVLELQSHGQLSLDCIIVYEHRLGDFVAQRDLSYDCLELAAMKSYGSTGVAIIRYCGKEIQ